MVSLFIDHENEVMLKQRRVHIWNFLKSKSKRDEKMYIEIIETLHFQNRRKWCNVCGGESLGKGWSECSEPEMWWDEKLFNDPKKKMTKENRDANDVTLVPGKVWGKDGVSAVNQENRRHWIKSDQN